MKKKIHSQQMAFQILAAFLPDLIDPIVKNSHHINWKSSLELEPFQQTCFDKMKSCILFHIICAKTGIGHHHLC